MNSQTSKILLAGLLIVAGTLLLLKNLGVIPYFIPGWVFSWQMLLIGIGLIIVLGKREGKTPGYILLAIGFYFLMPRIFNIDYDRLWDFWPLILIIVGIALLVQLTGKNEKKKTSRETNMNLDEFHIFGGSEKVIDNQNFEGGSITAIFGGSTIDLRQAQLHPDGAVIEVFAIFGGFNIHVPSTWRVNNQVNAILGGQSDERIKGSEITTGELTIKGLVIFGGGTLKN